MRNFLNGIIIGSFLAGIFGLITNSSRQEKKPVPQKATKITANMNKGINKLVNRK